MKFPDTHWSRVRAMGAPLPQARAAALSWFAAQYWKPVYHHLLALGAGSPSEAEDLTQQFFARAIERGTFEKLSPERGSVRGFLRASLRNFTIDLARSRRGKPVEVSVADAGEQDAGAVAADPQDAFDRAWVAELLDTAVATLKGGLVREGRQQQFAIFEAYCLVDDVTYADLAARFGITEHDVRNRLRETRQRLRAIVRGLVRRYLAPGEDLDREVAFIMGGH